ncbi:SsrA-binding protein SmpB [Erysipelothrix sp. HDW6B]|uniref:SsrA-binding protein SmpB n=1 Tax=Erysipelothrix sp. HDW6B TaxID=2714929 RepID=UPI00140A38BA|nr:SsrA-binding protein SmpB [Erysipelothrix sp. HDW6B]QIK85379.1 SsrA-binding protein SmpB [Erysipelothrix sp. HDW6B]
MSVVAKNRKAYHDYFIEDEFEAGMVLLGTEIKSIRDGKVQLKEAFISIKDGEAWIKGMHIGLYEQGNRFNHEELRDRKLLLHSHEIEKLQKGQTLQGYTIVPLNIHLSKGRAKLQIALAKGKHLYDKRQTEKERSQKRDIQKAMKGQY